MPSAQALARDPGFALGGVAIAALYMIGGFRGDHPEVVKALGAAEPAIRSGYGGTSEGRGPHDRQRTDEWPKTSKA